MNIKAVFFDYDGVLTTDRTGSLTTFSYISNTTGIDFEKISAVFRKFNNDLLIGKIQHKQIWKEICLELKANIKFEILTEAFRSTPINERAFGLAKKLKANYLVGIITDNKQDRMDCVREYQGLNALFDPIVVSSEIGCNKTNQKIFHYAVDQVNLTPEECVFIDNQQKNLVMPKKLGLHTILFNDELNDVGKLEEVLRGEMNLVF